MNTASIFSSNTYGGLLKRAKIEDYTLENWKKSLVSI